MRPFSRGTSRSGVKPRSSATPIFIFVRRRRRMDKVGQSLKIGYRGLQSLAYFLLPFRSLAFYLLQTLVSTLAPLDFSFNFKSQSNSRLPRIKVPLFHLILNPSQPRESKDGWNTARRLPTARPYTLTSRALPSSNQPPSLVAQRTAFSRTPVETVTRPIGEHSEGHFTSTRT